MTLKLKKFPLLRDQQTKDLRSCLDWMLSEAEMCQYDIAPGEKGTFLALAALVDMELRFRDPRRKPAIVAAPSGSVGHE